MHRVLSFSRNLSYPSAPSITAPGAVTPQVASRLINTRVKVSWDKEGMEEYNVPGEGDKEKVKEENKMPGHPRTGVSRRHRKPAQTCRHLPGQLGDGPTEASRKDNRRARGSPNKAALLCRCRVINSSPHLGRRES